MKWFFIVHEDTIKLIALIVLLVAIVTVVFVGCAALADASCDQQTSGMAYPHMWTILGGCRIFVPNDGWIPLGNYYYKGGQ